MDQIVIFWLGLAIFTLGKWHTIEQCSKNPAGVVTSYSYESSSNVVTVRAVSFVCCVVFPNMHTCNPYQPVIKITHLQCISKMANFCSIRTTWDGRLQIVSEHFCWIKHDQTHTTYIVSYQSKLTRYRFSKAILCHQHVLEAAQCDALGTMSARVFELQLLHD